ncbi:hypothetical protein C2S52_022617 [Perilla frutescens var. hirtella]|nr:hypothetical protein C2S52_022617 [Perilla frutescens var. hirtella]
MRGARFYAGPPSRQVACALATSAITNCVIATTAIRMRRDLEVAAVDHIGCMDLQ